MEQRAAAEQQRGDDAGQRLTGRRIAVGVVGVSYLENRGETPRKKTYGKKLAFIAFCMPFVYALLDAFGTFFDDAFFLVEDIANAPFVDVTEETIEAVANTSYELTFALFALILFIFAVAGLGDYAIRYPESAVNRVIGPGLMLFSILLFVGGLIALIVTAIRAGNHRRRMGDLFDLATYEELKRGGEGYAAKRK